jgi:RNA polymerase sigma-70 factor (ECF subfamily)
VPEEALTVVSVSVDVTDPSLADVFREHSAFVWRTLRHHGVAERELEDACQEVFVVVQQKLAEFRGDSSMTTWLYAIAWRVATGWRRRGARREEPVPVVPDAPEEPRQEQSLERARARERLARLLERLDDDKRAVIVLYEIEEMPMARVAEMVGCPLQTAYYRLHAARRELRAAWEEEHRAKGER